MKNNLLKIAGIILTSVFIFSCAPEEENNTPAPVDAKAKWIGNWNCTENTGANPGSTYLLHIVDSVGTSYVNIENLYSSGYQTKVRATVTESNIYFSPSPQAFGTGGFTISGSGTMNSNTNVTLNFTVNDGGAPDNVNATLIKQ